jgi:hypothetical protein
MNKKRIIAGAIFLAMAVVTVVVWLCVEKVRQPDAVITTAVIMSPKAIAPAREIPSDVSQNMNEVLAEREKKLSGLSLPKPVIVYAKVVDPTGRPISGAKAVIASAIETAGSNKNMEQISDSDGTLSFSTKWRMLSVTVSKPGYRDLIASSATFQYAKSAFTPPQHPDPSNPVIFVLQRR